MASIGSNPDTCVSGLKTGEAVVPQSDVQHLKAKTRELHREKTALACRLGEAGGHSVSGIAPALDVSRSNLIREVQPRRLRRATPDEEAAIVEPFASVYTCSKSGNGQDRSK